MKIEIVSPSVRDGEAAGRWRTGIDRRLAAGLLWLIIAQGSHASPLSCQRELTQLVVPALTHVAMARRTIRAELASLADGGYGARLFVPAHGSANRDGEVTIGWVDIDSKSMRLLDVTRDPDRPDMLHVNRDALAGFVSRCLPPDARERVNCEALNRRAEQAGVYIQGSDAGRIVTGRGRLQFYSAPDAACRIDGLFVIANDTVEAHTEYGRYTWVEYLNAKTPGPVRGWVRTDRLKPDGYGIAPRQP
ncbi:hypothetical protein [Burkholderia ubonensis]|uniref:hypothetical protein n=1 Tax=Burkholderia ubonensis TaxID=101571 RepID=UPI000AB18160|nr:hypothetical protein [Burkholderia ubonensis]